MKIAILSGKGGTGKTFVAVNLSAVAGRCAYLDCDVEEPNGHLFLDVANPSRAEVSVSVPIIDPDKCLGCRVCVQFCRFGALAFVNKKPLLTQSVCHACGGCAYLCPVGAIAEVPRGIGRIERGMSGDTEVRTGILNPGEVSGVPIIRELLSSADGESGAVFIDCPPGTACTAMECVRRADLCVLVAEPTQYGAHNLQMADELCETFRKPRVAVLNKTLEGVENPSEAFCHAQGIPIAAKIPFDEEVGRLAAFGLVAAEHLPWLRSLFTDLLDRIGKEAAQ
jgi:MinD superfamily P-loop ATPase